MYTEQTRCTLRKDSWQNHLQTFAEAQPEFLQRFSIAQQESGSSKRAIDGGSHVSYWVVLGTSSVPLLNFAQHGLIHGRRSRATASYSPTTANTCQDPSSGLRSRQRNNFVTE
jgi:hypothetical protein